MPRSVDGPAPGVHVRPIGARRRIGIVRARTTVTLDFGGRLTKPDMPGRMVEWEDGTFEDGAGYYLIPLDEELQRAARRTKKVPAARDRAAARFGGLPSSTP